jgi:hypothetical protein
LLRFKIKVVIKFGDRGFLDHDGELVVWPVREGERKKRAHVLVGRRDSSRGIGESAACAWDSELGVRLGDEDENEKFSVALRTLAKPPCVIADDSFAKPACAPNAAPTGWSSDVGIQIIVEAA